MYFCPDPPYVERRSKGRTVTVLKNVQGDVSGLLFKLKIGLGVGGTQVSVSQIELQGDQVKRLKSELEKLKAVTIVDEETDEPMSHSYHRKVEGYLSTPKFLYPTNIQNSDLCGKLHGDFWPYCIGTCQDVDFSDFFQTLAETPVRDSSAVKIPELDLDELFQSAELGASIGAAVMKRLRGEDPDEAKRPERIEKERKPRPTYQRPASNAKPAVNYVLRVRLPVDVDFGEFKLFVASACSGVLRIRQPGDSAEPRSLLGESSLQEVIIVFESIASLRSAKMIFDEMSAYQTRDDTLSSLDPSSEEEEEGEPLLSEEQWATVRMLELEENEFFWSRLFQLIESGQTMETAFADAVENCMPEEERFVPSHDLWLQLSAQEHEELKERGLESFPQFWESFELLTIAQVPGAFAEAVKLSSNAVKKEDTRKINCPICGKKFEEEIEVMRHLDCCVSRFSTV